jgi:riboflavin kinase/FMN adenylyltransferase
MATVFLSADGPPPGDCRGGAVSVGNFDGVHRGHAALVAELVARARRVGGPAVAVTFDPHPIALLAPERLQPLLTTPADRAELLQAAGADHVVVLKTTPELLHQEAREFLDGLFGDRLAVRAVVEGFNFRFGRGRAGDNELLADWCRGRGVALTVVPPFTLDGAVVSSSRVRSALEAGDVAAAARLLGRPYRLRGAIGTGAKRGRALGFPTANLERPATLVPGDGVYAVRAVLADGSAWPAAANVGPNPTFGEQARKVEAHLIGFAGDLYGRPLAVDFMARLRATRLFAGPADLVEQLRTDVAAARELVGKSGAMPTAWRGHE